MLHSWGPWLSKPSPRECKECEQFCLGVLINSTEFKHNFLCVPFEIGKKEDSKHPVFSNRNKITHMATFWDLRRPQSLSYRYLSYYKAILSMTLFLFIIILPLSTACKNYIYILFCFLDCTFFYATSVCVYIVCGCVWGRGLELTSGVLPQVPSIIASDQDVPLSWNWSIRGQLTQCTLYKIHCMKLLLLDHIHPQLLPLTPPR